MRSRSQISAAAHAAYFSYASLYLHALNCHRRLYSYHYFAQHMNMMGGNAGVEIRVDAAASGY